jgi:hypothetical protein
MALPIKSLGNGLTTQLYARSHKLVRTSDLMLHCVACSIDEAEVVKRITVTLDEKTHQILQQWADNEARTVPNLLAWLALKAAKEYLQENPATSKGK